MRRLLPLALAVGLLAGAAVPAAAGPSNRAIQNALVGVLVQLDDVQVALLNNSTVEVITVDVNRSLNNFLRNADIDVNVLNNSLNNIDIIDDINVDIQDVTVIGDSVFIIVNALGDTLVIT